MQTVPADAISVSHVASGSFNDIYRVSAGSETVILKSRNYEDPRGWASTEREAFALRNLRNLLSVPDLRFHSLAKPDFPHGYLVCSFKQGALATPSSSYAAAMGRTIASLHKTRLTEYLASDARHSRANVIRDCESLLNTLALLSDDILSYELPAELLRIIRSTSETPSEIGAADVYSHGDPVPSNFLVNDPSTSLTVLDWETFCLAPRTFDLWACTSSAFVSWDWDTGLTTPQKEVLLESYSESVGLPAAQLSRSVSQAASSYALRHGLWCLYRAIQIVGANAEHEEMRNKFLLISQRAFDEAERCGLLGR